MLKWLRAEGCPWDERVCAKAAYGGQLEVLKWLRAEECQTCFGQPWAELNRGRGLTYSPMPAFQRQVALRNLCPFYLRFASGPTLGPFRKFCNFFTLGPKLASPVLPASAPWGLGGARAPPPAPRSSQGALGRAEVGEDGAGGAAGSRGGGRGPGGGGRPGGRAGRGLGGLWSGAGGPRVRMPEAEGAAVPPEHALHVERRLVRCCR